MASLSGQQAQEVIGDPFRQLGARQRAWIAPGAPQIRSHPLWRSGAGVRGCPRSPRPARRAVRKSVKYALENNGGLFPVRHCNYLTRLAIFIQDR